MEALVIILFVNSFLSLLLAYKGKEKKIGFNKTLIISMLLSAIAGLIVVMSSPTKVIKRVRPKDKAIEL